VSPKVADSFVTVTTNMSSKSKKPNFKSTGFNINTSESSLESKIDNNPLEHSNQQEKDRLAKI